MGLGDFISGIFGSKNEAAKSVDPYKVDNNAFEYGGQPGGAQKQAGIYGNVANNYTQGAYGNFTTAQDMLGQQYGSRAQQQDALGLMAQRAHGQNLISQQITQQQQQQAAAQQAGLAASARGPASLAMAQQNAAANTGQATAQLGAQGAIAGAQEQLANEQAYMGGASGIRQQDIGAAGVAGSIGAQQGNLGLGYAGLENNVNQSQLAAQMNREAINSGNYNAAHGIQAGAQGQNASMNQQNSLGLLGALTSGGSSLVTHAATGGHLQTGQPYLVGEQGPELVLPKKDGFVMTAAQTAALLGAPPTVQQVHAMPGLARCMGGAMYPHRAEGSVIKAGGEPIESPRAAVTWGQGDMVPASVDRSAYVVPPNPYPEPQPFTLAGRTWGNATPSPAQYDEAASTSKADQMAREFLNYKYGQGATKAVTDAQGVTRQLPVDEVNQAKLAGIDRNRAMGLYETAPQSADEAAEEKRLRAAQGVGKNIEQAQQKTAEKKAQAEGKQARAAAGKSIGDGLQSLAGQVDTSYHAVGGGGMPALVAIPTYQAREFGGPMDAVPAGDFSVGNGMVMNRGGGLDIGASQRATNAIDTQYMKNPTSNPTGGMANALGGFGSALTKVAGQVDTGYHPVEAREEGGPVQSAAHRAAGVAVNLGTPVQLSAMPQYLSAMVRAAPNVLAAQGDAAGAERARQIASMPSLADRAATAMRPAAPGTIVEAEATPAKRDRVNKEEEFVVPAFAGGGLMRALGRCA